jgi:hypothetical protein
MAGIAEQIAGALRQQLEEGDHNLSEVVSYEPLNNAVQTGIHALFKRGDAKAETVMGVDYEEFRAEILVYTTDLLLHPRRGDRIRTTTEVWFVDGIKAELPGAYLLNAARKVLQPEVSET